MENREEYNGYETGPIRPPSEAGSLLLRVARNCPWNKCRFCCLYRGRRFSVRPLEHIIKDIKAIKQCIPEIEEMAGDGENAGKIYRYFKKPPHQGLPYHAAAKWYRDGMRSVFLQDADGMAIKADDMARVLSCLHDSFPTVSRITTYSRAGTVARKSGEELRMIKEAGLGRIHIGMESGSDKVLALVKKGADKATNILAGRKAKKAGIELSEYYMPGLGGNEYWEENALETADALSSIDPDYIRIRCLAVTENSELCEDYANGVFTRTNDTKMAQEILLMIKNLNGVNSVIVSDHIVNLLPGVEGVFPKDKQKMIDNIMWYLDLGEREKMIFRIGRRKGAMMRSKDLYDEARRAWVERYIEEGGINTSNIDESVDALMNRFI
jgi:hypothetical protein